MPQAAPQFAPSRDTLVTGHEPDHLSKRWLAIFVVGFLAFCVVTSIGLWWLLKLELRGPREADRRQSIVDDRLQEGPRLQPTQPHNVRPADALSAMHRDEDRVFAALGWQIDPQTHEARVPDALVNLLVEHAASAQPATTTHSPGGKR